MQLSNDSGAMLIESLDALHLLGLRIYALVHYLLTYLQLLTYTVSSGRVKPAISLKRLNR